MTNALLEVEDLKVHFPVRKGLFQRAQTFVYAVDGVSFQLNKGETLGVVGESGCGKTTTGLAILNLVRATSGKIRFKGNDISEIAGLPVPDQMRIRKELQIIFQDPYSSLNPRMTLNKILHDPMKIHGLYPGSERQDRIEFILKKVGLTPEQGKKYPHEFSGGQRQRIGIARALSLDPQIIIGDEPVSALDVSIQAQIINLMVDLQEEFNLSYIIIAHDLAVVEHISNRIAVMYLGKIIETAPVAQIYHRPQHPYTRALLSAVPIADPRAGRHPIILKGDVPSPRHPPTGCGFHPRCPECSIDCDIKPPELRSLGKEHYVACHYA
ncbi:MAG: ATP-binding cassette domain-containing protein [Desulfobacteraceae bacterium]|nr:ATP-binding cassette domain-containing protein [Desulfobacteraceae bacterium]